MYICAVVSISCVCHMTDSDFRGSLVNLGQCAEAWHHFLVHTNLHAHVHVVLELYEGIPLFKLGVRSLLLPRPNASLGSLGASAISHVL